MDSLKLNENSCRICLNHKVKLNWNEEILEFCGISYKDCYYKYTQLEEFDSDCYPTDLCEMCANELKNSHILFEKALESFNFLQAVLRTKELETKNSDMDICHSPHPIKYENQTFEEVSSHMYDTTLIEMEDERDSEIEETENELHDSEQIKENITVEPTHFVDIQRLESSAKIELSNIELLKSPAAKNIHNNGKNNESIRDTSLEQEVRESSDVKLSKSSTIMKALEKILQLNECYDDELPLQSTLEQNTTESCYKESVLPTAKPKKPREKYLMCAYCSLKVTGAVQLAKHEATHNENRKRTEACPHCGVKLYDKLALSQHIKTHDENRQKSHKCEFCGNTFYNRGSLNVHRRKHLGQMSKCRICSKEFFRQVDLDKHLLKHSASPLQKNVGEKKYVVKCEYCNESVRTVRYKAHVAVHLNQPQVKCKICEKHFFSRRNVTNHLRRIHHKKSSEFENCIHYYVDKKTRVSILMMKQQLSAQPITEIL